MVGGGGKGDGEHQVGLWGLPRGEVFRAFFGLSAITYVKGMGCVWRSIDGNWDSHPHLPEDLSVNPPFQHTGTGLTYVQK